MASRAVRAFAYMRFLWRYMVSRLLSATVFWQ